MLLQWFLLLVLIAGTVWVIALPGIRQNLVDERVLLARTIAHSLDTTISTAIQDLDRLATDLPLDGLGGPEGPPLRALHEFRLHSPFNHATYVLDEHAQVIAADPAAVAPIPGSALSSHETVTPLIRKARDAEHPVLAIVQPFTAGGLSHYVVSEMAPSGSVLSTFLKELKSDPTIDVTVVDEHDVVIASGDPARLLGTLPADPSRLTVTAPMRFATWRVVIQQPTGQAFSGLHTISRGLLITGLLLTLTGIFLARTLSRSVVSPIRHLSRQAEAMRAGDLSTPIVISGDHEIEVLARTLDDARARLASTVHELQAFNERLEEQVAARTQVIVQQDEQRKVLVRKMMSAIEDERRRFARELHDEIAQLLTVIQLSLHDVQTDSPELARANALLVKTQAEIHRLIHALRPSLLDDLGLAAAIRSFAEDHLRKSGVQYSLEIEDDLPSRPEIETVIFRIYQELITNILRHADAEQLSIQLYLRGGKIVLDVEDDGRGFDADAKTDRAGVAGMRERAALVNGTISFDSEPGAGTHVVLEIPLS